MKRRYIVSNFLKALAVLFVVAFFMFDQALAHCDTMDGPVVKAAQRAHYLEHIYEEKRGASE